MGGTPTGAGFTVAMTRATDTPGIDIVDPIEHRRCTLLTDEPVAPRSGDPDAFRFPVESAIEFEATEIFAPFTGLAWIRDRDGSLLEEVSNGFAGEFPPDTYSVELSGLIKIYLRIEGSFRVENVSESTRISFEAETTLTVGSRSAHTRPATTLTTTGDPVEVLSAVSTFGSALKTTSPERSFPTLRGHPPAIEIGNELDIPVDLESPIKDVYIEVPPRNEFVYPIAPLAYYLGVAAEPGQLPRIVGPDFEHALQHPQGFQRGVQEVLQQVFFLDCITRTEGLYPVDLYERERVESRVELPFSELYEAPMSERLNGYLEVPFAVIEDLLPDWRLAAHVDDSPESATMLPYLANDLAIITMADPEIIPSTSVSTGMAGFTRGATGADTRGTSAGDATFVRPRGGADAVDTAWVSDGTPVNATKAVPQAYRNKFGRTPQDHSIEIAVVCNSADMNAEREFVNDVYGTQDELPFDVQVHEEMGTEALADLIHRDFNFLHYIGHIDSEGFRCPDGRLDIAGYDDIGPEAFFLNACQSYDQGLALIEGGAIGGIVTLNDIVNHGAVRIGQAVARLLDSGFPLRAALNIASNRSVIGRQYVVVGDGNLSIVQAPSGTPHTYHLNRNPNESEFGIRIHGFGAPPGMGCLYMPFLEDDSRQYLAGGVSEEYTLRHEELRPFLMMENVPVIIDEEFTWSFDVSLEN